MSANDTACLEPPAAIEPMIDGKEAAILLKLPLYWFTDRSVRRELRIPHYELVGVIRYRASELVDWLERLPKGK